MCHWLSMDNGIGPDGVESWEFGDQIENCAGRYLPDSLAMNDSSIPDAVDSLPGHCSPI